MAQQDFDDLLRTAHSDFSRGDFVAVLASAETLSTLAPHRVEPLVLRANAELQLARWTAAIVTLERLIIAQPQQAQFRRLLGLSHLRHGNQLRANADHAGAIVAYRRSIAADPAACDARHNLALVFLTMQRAAEAVPLLEQVLAAEPLNELVRLDLARAFFITNRNDEALQLALGADMSKAPELARGWSIMMLDFGYAERSSDIAIQLATADPETVQWVLYVAKRLRDGGAMAANVRLLDATFAQKLSESDRLAVSLQRALGLPAVNLDARGIDEARAGFSRGLDNLVADYPTSRVAALDASIDALRWDNFFLAYHGRNDRDLAQRFGDWFSASLAALLPSAAFAHQTNAAHPRVGLVSGRLHRCTVGMYFASWVEHLFAHGWDVTLVHIGAFRDEWTEHLAQHAHAEITLTGEIANRALHLRDAAFDLLLYPELGMDSTVFTLAGLRLAPVQLCAWGHPSTTGLPTIDGFLSCASMEPDNAPTHYREPLLLLPGLGTRYPRPPVPAPLSRAALNLASDRHLYLVPQSAFKLHPDNDAVFAKILELDAKSTLVFFNDREVGASRMLQHRLRAINACNADSIRFLDQCSREDFLRINLVCDVMVDSLHWSGGNTSLDALHCGLPVVTCPGALMRGRQSAAMLRALDCAELIVPVPDQLAHAAVAIAKDRARRDALSARIVANLPALTDSNAALRALDRILRSQLRPTAA